MSERPVHEQIRELSDALVVLATHTRRNLLDALEAMRTMDTAKARAVKEADREIDEAAGRLETRCLSFLALQQPLARDFRTIVAILKITDDIGRISKLTVHIVERMFDIGTEAEPWFNFELMGAKVSEMLLCTIDAFSTMDVGRATRVEFLEEEVDAMHRAIVRNAMAALKSSPGDVERLIAVLGVSRYLERIADHATKAAREILYLVTGEVSRQHESSYEKLLDTLRN